MTASTARTRSKFVVRLEAGLESGTLSGCIAAAGFEISALVFFDLLAETAVVCFVLFVAVFFEPATFERFDFSTAGLLAFFDGDTDDLYCRCADIIRVARRDGH